MVRVPICRSHCWVKECQPTRTISFSMDRHHYPLFSTLFLGPMAPMIAANQALVASLSIGPRLGHCIGIQRHQDDDSLLVRRSQASDMRWEGQRGRRTKRKHSGGAKRKVKVRVSIPVEMVLSMPLPGVLLRLTASQI